MKSKGFNLLETIIIILIIITIILIFILSRLKVGSTVVFKSTGDKGIITAVLNNSVDKCYSVKFKDKELIIPEKDIKRG